MNQESETEDQVASPQVGIGTPEPAISAPVNPIDGKDSEESKQEEESLSSVSEEEGQEDSESAPLRKPANRNQKTPLYPVTSLLELPLESLRLTSGKWMNILLTTGLPI